MKRFILSLGILSGIFSTANAQELSYGLKGGINYANGGQITGLSHMENGEYKYWTGIAETSSKIGLHAGAFFKMDFDIFYLRPELVYTSLKTEFIFPGEPSDFKVTKFDVPVLAGFNFGPASVFAGPAFSFVSSATLEGKEMTTDSRGTRISDGEDIEYQTFPMNLQFGASVEFGSVGFDVRYEHNLSKAEQEYIDVNHNAPGWHGVNRAVIDDSRLSQIIIGLYYKIGETNSRRGRSYGRYRRR